MIHVLVPMNFPQSLSTYIIELNSGHKKIKIEKDQKWQKKCIENYIYKSMIRLQCTVLIQTNGIFKKERKVWSIFCNPPSSFLGV